MNAVDYAFKIFLSLMKKINSLPELLMAGT
jgi:hypothetical protein